MEDFIIQNVNNKPVKIQVIRKRVKRLSLRIDVHGQPVATVPYGVSRARVVTFLNESAEWLSSHMRQRIFFELPSELRTGDNVLIFGRYQKVILHKGKLAPLTVDNGYAVITCPKPEDPGYAARAYEALLKKFAGDYFTKEFENYYYLISSRYRRPSISVRKMTSRWGSANPSRMEIHLSLYLIQTPKVCIDSVVLHETSHFLVMDHSDAFYRVVLGAMPDYWERKKLLNQYAAL